MPIDPEYKRDRSFSDRCIPAATAIAARIAELVGRRGIHIACEQRDRCEATDLVVLRADEMAIAFRVRRRTVYETLRPYDITIRAHRPGSRTEAYKIFVEGWAQYFIYGFGEDDGSMPRWIVVDLEAVRLHASFGRRYADAAESAETDPKRVSALAWNKDGTALLPIDTRNLPRTFFPLSSPGYWGCDSQSMSEDRRADLVQKVLRLRDNARGYFDGTDVVLDVNGKIVPPRELMARWIQCMARGTATDDDVTSIIRYVDSASSIHYPDCTCTICFERRLARAEGR